MSRLRAVSFPSVLRDNKIARDRSAKRAASGEAASREKRERGHGGEKGKTILVKRNCYFRDKVGAMPAYVNVFRDLTTSLDRYLT